MKLKHKTKEIVQINRSVSQNFQKLNNPQYIEVVPGQQFVKAQEKLNSKNKLIKQITESRLQIEAKTKDITQVFQKDASVQIYLSKINQQSQNNEHQLNQNQEKTNSNLYNLIKQLKNMLRYDPLFQQLGLAEDDIVYQAELITLICLKGQFLKPPHDQIQQFKYSYKQLKQIKKTVYIEMKHNKINLETIQQGYLWNQILL